MTIDEVRLMLDREEIKRSVRNDFQEGVMAAIVALVPSVTRQQFDDLMIKKANEYANSRVPENAQKTFEWVSGPFPPPPGPIPVFNFSPEEPAQ